jgi:hypothetical protein
MFLPTLQRLIFEIARTATCGIALVFVLLTLGWIALAFAFTLSDGLSADGLLMGTCLAIPGFVPALGAWFFFDRARTASL